MLQDIYYSRKSNQAVQVISQCQIIPEGTDAICFQELTGEFGVFVVGKELFFQNYHKQGKGMDLTDRGRENTRTREEKEEYDSDISGILRFLDADTYKEKMKVLEGMKDKLDDRLLNNMAVSLDLTIDDGVDGYSFLMSELKIRSRFEGR